MAESANNKKDTSVAFLLGLIFSVLGIKTFFYPIYYFRGDYVDFTGYNKWVGSGFFAIGLVFWEFCRRRRKL